MLNWWLSALKKSANQDVSCYPADSGINWFHTHVDAFGLLLSVIAMLALIRVYKVVAAKTITWANKRYKNKRPLYMMDTSQIYSEIVSSVPMIAKVQATLSKNFYIERISRQSSEFAVEF